jgi:hypothetical protein
MMRIGVCRHTFADSSLTTVRANLGERRRTDDRAERVDLYSRRTPANDRVHAVIESKTAEGNLVRVRLPLSAPRFRIRSDRILLSQGPPNGRTLAVG